MQIIEKSTYRLPAGIRNILLIQLGDIGDVVWTTPAIHAVKKSIPDARVTILVKEGFGGLLEADPDINEMIEIRRYRGSLLQQAARQLSFLRDFRSRHFDLAVDLRLGDRGAWMALLSGAPLRVTMYHPEGVPWWRKFFFTHAAMPTDLAPERGAAEQTLRILRTLGIDTDDKLPRLWVSDTVRKRVAELLSREKLDAAGWISVNPFSRWSYKEWDESKWVEMIDWLWRDFSLATVIIGSADERQKTGTLIQKCKGKAHNLAGRTTLAELAGLLSISLLHIGVDSAAPHIAAAVGTPTITIYGPSSWFDWSPPGNSNRIIVSDMACVPCRRKGCDDSGRSRCLEELNIDRVKTDVDRVLQSLDIKGIE